MDLKEGVHTRKPLLKSAAAFAALALLVSPAGCVNNPRFDARKWNQKDDVGNYPCREAMVFDLTNSLALPGMDMKDAETIIGPPDYRRVNSFYYTLRVDFGSDIDPVFVRYLVLEFTPAGVLKSVGAREFRK